MLKKCALFYRDDATKLAEIERFRDTYKQQEAITWYTKDSFIYRLVNKALRTEDIDLLYSFRFFITDLCAQLEERSRRQNKENKLTLYRGSRLPEDILKQLRQSIGGLISINSFLSTTRAEQTARVFAGQGGPKPAREEIVLFNISAKPSLSTVVFADVQEDIGWTMDDEQEVLFSLNATFKIEEVVYDTVLELWKVKMTGTDEGSERVRQYLRFQQKTIHYNSPMICFGNLMFRYIGQVDRAERYFDTLLKTLPEDHPDLACIYCQLGQVYEAKGELDSALKKHMKAYEIRQRTLPPDHPDIASSLNALGHMYRTKNIEQALDFYQQSLAIYKKRSCHQNEMGKAAALQNLGNIYLVKHEFDTALRFYKRSRRKYSRLMPPKHPIIATCLRNIGLVHESKGKVMGKANREFDRALNYYLRALEIVEYSLPYDHPNVIKYLEWIVRIHKKKEQSAEAFFVCGPKLEREKNDLSEKSGRVAMRLMIIANLLEEHAPKHSMETYNEALTMFEQLTPPADSRTIVRCLDAMRRACWKRHEYAEALVYALKALNLQRSTLSHDHTDLGLLLRNVGHLYKKMGKLTEASDYFNESLLILQANYDNSHLYVKRILADIAGLSPEALTREKDRTEAMRKKKEEYVGALIAELLAQPLTN
ncbi:unnamed protein product [Didymodactylos carnosus]|uniref:Uncharacterized protein n=1 Tax=Didymodactylos carnosus TaxID=1234261 RepID=A0A814A6V6_9BILA|nr:unnamed protein product [Didymodactylos carnosus]CAF3690266.1 unnamed protein product [Didymodactylos carnosus]